MNTLETQTLIPHIKKRGGAIVPFNQDKITLAITKAFHATGKDDESQTLKISDRVMERLLGEKQTNPADSIPMVEHIQDLVEEELMRSEESKAAKSYILYREKKNEGRELKRAMLGMPNVETKVGINQLRVLKERYLLKDDAGKVIETPEQLYRRVADNIASAELLTGGNEETVKHWSDQFFQLMDNNEFMPNTPTLMNAGTPMQQLSACFVLPIEDSITGIYDTLKHQAIIHQSGGGTGFDFSRLRQKGSIVKSTKGVASGPISFLKVYDASTQYIKQGGKRRGANMGILRVDHPDIHDFIHCKDDGNTISNFNISVALTEKFMQAVERNEDYELIDPRTKQVARKENAKALYDELIASAWKTGDPGIIFIDRINRDNPVPHIYTIEATNPCISGNMRVSTANGLIKMEELAQQNKSNWIMTDNRVPVQVMQDNGLVVIGETGIAGTQMRFASPVIKTGTKEVFKLETHSGYEIECTDDHKIYTNNGFVSLKNLDLKTHEVYIQAGEGKFGKNDALPFVPENHFIGENNHQYHSNLPTDWSKELGQVLGWLVGDGWVRIGDKNCRVGFTFAESDMKILESLKPIINHYYNQEINEVKRENGVYHLSYHSKHFVNFFIKLGIKPVDSAEKCVPESIFTAPKKAVTGFLQGLFTADGTANFIKGSNAYVRLTSKSLQLIKDVQLLLLNYGIKSRIYNRSRAPRNLFPYTTKSGEAKTYYSDGILYELNVGRESVIRFIEQIGFMGNKHANTFVQFSTQRFRPEHFAEKIKSITPIGKKEVYDLTEPMSHSFIGNGLCISNCGEQPLGPYDSCNLGSINLAKYLSAQGEVEWDKLRQTIRTTVRFLDNTIDMNKYPIPQIRDMNKGNRRIGLGVMGWSDILYKLNIPYNSEEGCAFAEKMAKFIRDEADAMSQELGKEKGVFLHWKGSIYDMPNGPTFRNCARITIAPTGTISMIADCSSGIEPLFAISFVKRVMDGQELLYVNEIFKETAIKRGFYSEELMERIASEGTAQHCEEIPEDIRKVFVCAHDISPYWHLRMQAAWQKYTDNAISKTVNFSHHATVNEVAEVYMLAYKLGCKGVTIYRDGSKGFENQVLNLNVKGKSSKQVEDDYKAKVLSGGAPATPSPTITMAAPPRTENAREKELCPKCSSKNFVAESGCDSCKDCGYSACHIA